MLRIWRALAAGFTVPSSMFLPANVGQANNFNPTQGNFTACVQRPPMPSGGPNCIGYHDCTRTNANTRYINATSPGNPGADQFFYWRGAPPPATTFDASV